jgi:ribosome-associated protein
LDPLYIDSTLTLPALSMSWTAVRASGPGGQNVNKVSTKVELRFDPESSTMNPVAIGRLRALAGAARLDADKKILLTSQKTREQPRNLEDAREKLRELVTEALVRPKKRRPTKPSKRAQARRLDSKSKESKKKKERRSPRDKD